MRFTHPDGSTVHLAYCSNVHPAETVDGVIDQISTYAGPIRQRLGRSTLGLGLWLAAEAALVFDEDPDQLCRLRTALATAGYEVVTLNGFPYTGFHDPVVKRKVYRPDWTEDARVDHTLRLARVLARLLPDDVTVGTISTLPLGWREGFEPADLAAALGNLATMVDGLAALEAQTGKRIALAIEPEPGCRVETTSQLAEVLSGRGGSHLGACLDLCHLAVQFEEGDQAAIRLSAAGIPIHKAQVSAGLRIVHPAQPVYRIAAAPFADSPFLHQTRERVDGEVVGTDDLHEALAGGLPGEEEWRVHFHLPIHQGGADSTRDELERSLQALVGGDRCLVQHLEVETYTWGVMPPGKRPDDAADPIDGLITGIAAEMAWVIDHLISLGLRPAPEESTP